MYGLGLRLKKSTVENLRSLDFDVGLGHYIRYFLPLDVKCVRRKKKFVIFSFNILSINNTIRHLTEFKPLNPYKIRGIKNLKVKLKMKVGKKQTQR